MEPPLSTLVFVILGFCFSLCAFLVESQDPLNLLLAPPVVVTFPPPPPLSHSPPPPPSHSPPPPPSPSPPPPPSPSPPPPPSPSPPPPSPSPPPPDSTPPPLFPSPPPPSVSPPPPPSHHRPALSISPTQSKFHEDSQSKHENKENPSANKINTGKKIGLLFAGIAGILQICVVGFLLFKRHQLLKINGRYENCSS